MPSDIAEAVSQDEIADSLMSEPEPSTETAENQTEETQVDDQQQPEEQQQEEQADDWLPTEQEKVFPDEVLQRYAKRYGYSDEEYANLDPRSRQLLHDKINSDIWIQQRNQQQEEEEPVQQARQEPTQPQFKNADEWMENVKGIAKQYQDPGVAMYFAKNFLSSFGVKDAPSQEMADGLASVFTTGVLNVLNSVLPNMLNAQVGDKTFFQNLVEQNFEGFSEAHSSSSLNRAWSKATEGIQGLKGKSLSDMGEQLEQAAIRYAGSAEDFENMVFKGKDGKPLSNYQNNVRKYSILGKLVAGQSLSAGEAKSFMDAGRKAAERSQIRKSAGNLGSGKSNSIASNSGDDDFWKEGVDLYRQQHGRI